MFDSYNRKIHYLRISVTDRCNLRCTYCMPSEGVPLLSHSHILSYEEIFEVVKTGIKFGIDKIRITGGEPLVRKGITELIRKISSLNEIKDLAMTTNGLLLSKYAKDLAEAGLNRINISLDTIRPELFSKITRGGHIQDVFKGIDAAREAGLGPIKINTVRTSQSTPEIIDEVKQFCKENGLNFRLIRQMDLETGEFYEVEGGTGGICRICNRLRLTADGFLKPCLFSDVGFSVREMPVEEAYLKTIAEKPECGVANHVNSFSNIGG